MDSPTLPNRGRIWMVCGVLYMTVTMRHKYFGTCMDTLRECYDWMKDDAIFDDDYEVVIDLPDLKTTITNDEEWALAMLTIK